MTALSEYRAKAQAQFPGKPVEFEDGTAVVLRSIIDLSDAEGALFNENVRKIQELDETAELADLRSMLVATLADISDNREVAVAGFSGESVSVLMVVLQDVTGGADDASKSAQGPSAAKGRKSANR